MRFVCVGALLFLSLSTAQQPSPIDPKYAPLAEQLFNAAEPDRAGLLGAHPELANHALVTTMSELAGRIYDREDFERALPMYEIVAGIARQLHDGLGEANSEHNIGLTLSSLYRIDEGMRHFDQAIAIYEIIGARSQMVSTLNSVGMKFHDRGDMNSSLPYLERALTEAEAAKDPIGIAQTSLHLGTLYKDTGRYRESVQALLRSLDIIRNRPGFERRVGAVLNNLGAAYFDQHELDLALNYHQQSLALKEKAHAPEYDIASSLLNIALDYQALEQPDKAMSYYGRILDLTAKSNVFKHRVVALANYGTLLHQLGRIREASAKLTEAVEISRRIDDRPSEAAAHIELAEIAVEERRHEDAVRELEPVADFARRENIPRTLIRADDVLGIALQALGRKAEAEATLEEAIRTVERARAELPGERQAMAAFMTDEIAVYRHMMQFQAENGKPELALLYSERSKGRTLLDVLQSGGNPIAKEMTAAERAREQQLKDRVDTLLRSRGIVFERRVPEHKRMAAISAELEKARNEFRGFEMELYTAHPELRVERVAFDPSSSADLAASLPDAQTALLEYATTDGGPLLFVLTQTPSGPSLKHYPLKGDKDGLSRDVLRFREQIANRDLDYRKLGASLYQQLVEPAREQLRGKTTLIIVPDSVLWQLPFQALESRPNRHLLEEYAVYYAPSMSVLREMQKVHQKRQMDRPRVMAVEALAPRARQEATGLRQVYGAANVRVLSGAEADHEVIRKEASNYQVLHFSAHGVFQDRNPMESYLVLAKAGKPEAGLLPARDMMSLDLKADMVVLAGCETGRGESGSGEGLIGMSWALFIAGSPATVASQWKVDAESTSEFMLDFHRRLRETSKAKALQGAALAIMRKPQFRHPFYWSGFVLVGEGY